MDCYVVEGVDRPLRGEITLQGSKNSVLPILAATLLNKGISRIKGCPEIEDVKTACKILRELGCKVFKEKDALIIDSSMAKRYIIRQELMKKMRSSIVFMGSLLSVNKNCVVSYPGGCCLGERPVDLHIDALKSMGASIYEIYGSLYGVCEKLKGAEITLKTPSVGATENIMLCATLAEGTTTIINPAKEPEIEDLQGFLNSMGAKIEGAGTDKITINGVRRLNDFAQYEIMPDRIACVTYMALAVATDSEITINNVNKEHIKNEVECFEKMGATVFFDENRLTIKKEGLTKGFGKITTNPYPSFPTDSQPFMCVCALKAEEECEIEETVFGNRFLYADELKKMGARINRSGNRIKIQKNELKPVDLYATDLRGGAALVIASLASEGTKKVYGIEHIERGYENFEDIIRSLGGNIYRENEKQKSN